MLGQGKGVYAAERVFCVGSVLMLLLKESFRAHVPRLKSAPAVNRGKVKAYYAAEGAFYTASVFMLLLWEERRKDFWAMLLHHVVTFALITASYSLS